jgi:hypothetical protein
MAHFWQKKGATYLSFPNLTIVFAAISWVFCPLI